MNDCLAQTSGNLTLEQVPEWTSCGTSRQVSDFSEHQFPLKMAMKS